MRQTTYNINDRRINWAEGTNITGNENVDKFHFEFDSEWDAFNAKFFVLIVEGTSYIDQLDNENSVILRDVVYDKENVEFGVYGIDTTNNAKLSTNIIGIETTESIWGKIRDISDLPSKTQWEIYTEEMLGLLAQGAITLEECQQALADARSARDTAEGYKNTTKGYMDTAEGYKNTAKGYMDTTEGFKNDTALLKQQTQGIVDIFDANVTQKTTDFNDNASAKTTAFNNNATAKTTAFNENYTEKAGVIDQKASDFNSNYDSKLSAFNSNATDKTSAFDSNASSKTTAFNNNATSKTSDFNTNATNKTTAFNSNATDKTTAFDNNATSKTGDFDQNASSKTTAFNENYQAKLDSFNENAESYDKRIINLELLKSNLNVQKTTKDTYHNIVDSLNAKIEDLVVCGNTTQVQTEGKQLFDVNATLYGGTIEKYNNGFKLHKTNNRTLAINLPKSIDAGSYTLSYIIVKSTLSDISKANVNVIGNGQTLTNVAFNSNGSANFTISTQANQLYFYISNSETDNAEITLDNVMIRLASITDATYEQYTGRTTFTFSNISTRY